MAALATTERFLRSSKRAQRACRRRLAACPRARAAGEAAPSAAATRVLADTVLGDARPPQSAVGGRGRCRSW